MQFAVHPRGTNAVETNPRLTAAVSFAKPPFLLPCFLVNSRTPSPSSRSDLRFCAKLIDGTAALVGTLPGDVEPAGSADSEPACRVFCSSFYTTLASSWPCNSGVEACQCSRVPVIRTSMRWVQILGTVFETPVVGLRTVWVVREALRPG